MSFAEAGKRIWETTLLAWHHAGWVIDEVSDDSGYVFIAILRDPETKATYRAYYIEELNNVRIETLTYN